MSWQQDILEQLEEVGNVAVRYDVDQNITNTEKARARNNIDITNATVEQISGDDYRLVAVG